MANKIDHPVKFPSQLQALRHVLVILPVDSARCLPTHSFTLCIVVYIQYNLYCI